MSGHTDGFESVTRVLGIDLACSGWDSNGSALLTFRPGTPKFTELRAPALEWPCTGLSAVAMADTLDNFARQVGVTAIALDGPQGWRDPETPTGTPGVGRRCEFECRTQAKTGAYPQTYPSNQVRWVQFCVEVFASLLARRGVHLGGAADFPDAQRDYVILECFPTSIWRSAGLTPLPAKSRKPDLGSFAEGLFSAFGLPGRLQPAASHDDLQAVVGALAAAAYVGGPAALVQRGVEPVVRQAGGRSTRTEGYIWDAKPLTPITMASSAPPDLVDNPSAESAISAVRVTQNVIDQVTRAGRSQAQIVLRGFPRGSNLARVDVQVETVDDAYPLVVGDSHAAWVNHQVAEASEGFDRLFARLSDRPDEWLSVTWRKARPPAHALQGEHLASQGPPIPDNFARTVSIPIRVTGGTVAAFDADSLPELGDCVGDLIVPAFAIKNPQDLEQLTKSEVRLLLNAGTPLLCRVSGPRVPENLKALCRAEPVPDAGNLAAFVEVVLEEPLHLVTRGTKRAVLSPTPCVVPALSNLRVASLNEAYRRISERFEPTRRSVGGNVYRSVYFFNPSLDKWRPIGELRGDLVFEWR